MKFNVPVVLMTLVLGTMAAPTPNSNDGYSTCEVSVKHPDGTVTTTINKRCAIPWTKNYAEYDEE